MTDTQISGADIEALAAKLDGMTDEFSEAERAALYAVFHLAGSAIADGDADTEGFGFDAYRNASFSFSWGGEQGILIGLNQGLGFGAGGGPHVGGITKKLGGISGHKW